MNFDARPLFVNCWIIVSGITPARIAMAVVRSVSGVSIAVWRATGIKGNRKGVILERICDGMVVSESLLFDDLRLI